MIEIRSRYDATKVIYRSETAESVREAVIEAVTARAYLAGADLAGADLAGAYLTGAYLADAYLANADLADADLARANLAGADLAGANLAGANLARANLAGANLAGANLARANLAGANLAGAYLADAYLADAYLARAAMPNGLKWPVYRLDPMAGICDDPIARERAVAAWGNHSWRDCPMHAAHGWNGLSDAPADKRRDVACFVAVFDARLLDPPVSPKRTSAPEKG